MQLVRRVLGRPWCSSLSMYRFDGFLVARKHSKGCHELHQHVRPRESEVLSFLGHTQEHRQRHISMLLVQLPNCREHFVRGDCGVRVTASFLALAHCPASFISLLQKKRWNLDVSFPSPFEDMLRGLSFFSFDFLNYECFMDDSNYMVCMLRPARH